MKKQILFPLRGFFYLFFLVFIITSCTNNNWPKFRGPEGNMIVTGNLPLEWGDSLNIRWTSPMAGESWSSPIIYGDKVFYTSAMLIKKAPATTTEDSITPARGNDESYLEDVYSWKIHCLDLKTGKQLWEKTSFEGNPRINKHAGSTYACETPVTDGERIYVYYGMIGVYCYGLNGNQLWSKDLGAYKTANGWGTGSSPVLYNNKLYVLVDNEENSFLVALDAENGKEIWRKSRDEKTTYSTPVIWENNSRNELITLGSKARSYNPENGELLWELTFNVGRAVASPVFDKERLYLGLSGGPRDIGPLHAVKAGANGDITPGSENAAAYIAWSDTSAGLGNPSPVLYQGLLYVVSDRGGEVSCFDATTGEKIYKEKAGKAAACWASPWVYNDHLYFYDEKGVTNVVKTGREFEATGSNSIDDKFWASIAASKDAYIFKGVENIYCVGN